MAQDEYLSPWEGHAAPPGTAPFPGRRAAFLDRFTKAFARRRRTPELTNEEHHRRRLAENEQREREYTALMRLLATTLGTLR
ncbi:hypothetical protein ACI3KY_11105 [Microbacterium sp. ZW T2_14]|uniref:hypothetical protein n=1 Tax=Microbacterium sp. ZW T2_14 TaxID=3378079 RepID=UPI003853B3C3